MDVDPGCFTYATRWEACIHLFDERSDFFITIILISGAVCWWWNRTNFIIVIFFFCTVSVLVIVFVNINKSDIDAIRRLRQTHWHTTNKQNAKAPPLLRLRQSTSFRGHFVGFCWDGLTDEGSPNRPTQLVFITLN